MGAQYIQVPITHHDRLRQVGEVEGLDGVLNDESFLIPSLVHAAAADHVAVRPYAAQVATRQGRKAALPALPGRRHGAGLQNAAAHRALKTSGRAQGARARMARGRTSAAHNGHQGDGLLPAQQFHHAGFQGFFPQGRGHAAGNLTHALLPPAHSRSP